MGSFTSFPAPTGAQGNACILGGKCFGHEEAGSACRIPHSSRDMTVKRQLKLHLPLGAHLALHQKPGHLGSDAHMRLD